jgi:endoglycosylceramidase
MRSVGFNVIRLCMSWSELEPTPGVYSATYLDRMEQIVGWASEQDIYVFLDFHEDLYSRFILASSVSNETWPSWLVPTDGDDGAPAWAVKADGWPPVAIGGQSYFNLVRAGVGCGG